MVNTPLTSSKPVEELDIDVTEDRVTRIVLATDAE